MKQKLLRLLAFTLIITTSSCDRNENIEPDYELNFANELASHLTEHGFQVDLIGNKIYIHRQSILSAEKLAQNTYDFLSIRNISINRLDLEKSIMIGFEHNFSQSRAEEIECGSTGFEQYANGFCTFEYCWDDDNIDYYYMNVFCV